MASIDSAQDRPNMMTYSVYRLILTELKSQIMPSFHERSISCFGSVAGSHSIESRSFKSEELLHNNEVA